MLEWLLVAQNARDTVITQWNRIANLRLVSAAATVIAAAWWIRTAEPTAGIVTAGLALAFLACLVWHRRVGDRRNDLTARVTIRARALARVMRDWHALPVPMPAAVGIDHPYALDLDLIGHGSLQQLIDTSQTPAGAQTMLDWLVHGASTESIRERQTIARELSGADDWRERLAAAGMVAGRSVGDPRLVVHWLEETHHQSLGVRHLIAGLMTGATVLMALLCAIEVVGFGWLLPLLLANALLTFLAPGAGELARLRSHQRALGQYSAVLPVAEAIPGSSAAVINLRARFSTNTRSASSQLSALDRSLAFVIPAGTMIWLPLQIALNWDLLVEARIHHLAATIGPRIGGWIETVGEIEALSALADCASLNQDWTWPDVRNDAEMLDEISLGHPLIPPGRRVANNVTIGPPGKVLLVTGSNMAGKSTLLRATGLNAVLARAGGPVCATAFSMPNRPIWSSVRIQDSLEQGISLYMAELLRLKQIVDAAKSGPIVYLLDEVLQGTNTAERRIAARSVIRQLLRLGAIGAVSTHDLELVDKSLEQATVPVHLVDQIVEGPAGPEMHFDYKLRPGLAPSSNALKLLELVGLDEQDADQVGGLESECSKPPVME